jgi:flagellin-specific chaperone FliS
MKIKKSKVSKASKKHKNKNGGGGKFILKPLPREFLQSQRMSPSYQLAQSLTRPIPFQPLHRSLSQNPRQSLSISPITEGSENKNKTKRFYDELIPKPKSRSSNRNSQGSPRALIQNLRMSPPRQRSPSISSIINPDIYDFDKNRPIYLSLDPVRTTKTGNSSSHKSPRATSNHGSPKVLSRHSSPKATSNHGSPKATSNQGSPKATSRHSSPKATSRHSSPKATSNQGIIIKRPILSYDKVNQRHLLIDLENCNEEYTDRLKKYNYDLKHNTKRWHEDIYQYGSSFKRIIRFARELLNTGNNLLQDDNVIAKKAELKRMLDNFEAYLNELNEINKVKRAIKPNNIIDNDQIFHTDLKVTLDMTKEIVNKLNALYGSTLRQSYLRKIANIGEKMGRIPEKIRDVATSFNQYNFRDLFKQKIYTDDMRHGIMIEQYQKRMAARSKR